MQIHELEALGRTPATGDKLVIDTGELTAKIDYDALATAIINKLGGDPVTAIHAKSVLSVAGNSNPVLNFYNGDKTKILGGIFLINGDPRFKFRTYRETNAANYEDYNLPIPAATGSNVGYDILTSKLTQYPATSIKDANLTGDVLATNANRVRVFRIAAGDQQNTPYAQGLTQGADYTIIEIGSDNYCTQYALLAAENTIFVRKRSGSGSTWAGKRWDWYGHRKTGVSPAGSVTFDLVNNGRYRFTFVDAGPNRTGEYLVSCNSSGSVTCVVVKAASGITTDVATARKIKFTYDSNTSTPAYCVEALGGDEALVPLIP